QRRRSPAGPADRSAGCRRSAEPSGSRMSHCGQSRASSAPVSPPPTDTDSRRRHNEGKALREGGRLPSIGSIIFGELGGDQRAAGAGDSLCRPRRTKGLADRIGAVDQQLELLGEEGGVTGAGGRGQRLQSFANGTLVGKD